MRKRVTWEEGGLFGAQIAIITILDNPVSQKGMRLKGQVIKSQYEYSLRLLPSFFQG